MSITRRMLIAAALLAPTATLADEPTVERKPIDESPLYVSDILNWDQTTDEEWQALYSLVTRYIMADPAGVQAMLDERAAAISWADAGKESTDAATHGDIPDSEIGECRFWVSSAGGTTEGGNVPQVSTHGAAMLQLGVNAADGDGSICTILYDGVEVDTIQFTAMTQGSIDLAGDQLAEGTHIVELVRFDGDVCDVHKVATIELVP